MHQHIKFLVATTVSGFLTLSFFAVIQRKIMGFDFTPEPKAFVIPFVYGGTIGLILGLRQLRIWKNEAILRDTVEKLQEQREELQATDEMLRQQVEEFIETHDRLVVSESRLQEQNDQLLATEEMLRVQIEEYEANRILLQKSNESLQTLFDLSPLAITISSYPDNIIREVNHTFVNEFGYPLDSIIGKTSLEIGLLNRNGNQHLINNEDEHPELSGVNMEVSTLQGTVRNVLVYSKQMDYKGERCLLTMYMDVTEQKRMGDILRQTQKMDVIGQLAGGVAHDFNNMLSAIMASAELLSPQVQDNVRAAKFVSMILEAANRSADLTRQLLVFSRKGEKTSVPVCIDNEIKTVVSMLERTIDKSITLETRLVAANATVHGDPALLQNALLNLGVNARDAISQGGTITFATANVELDDAFGNSHGFTIKPGPFIEISVSDTGSGMSKDVVEHIFEPFFTTKEVGKGTGLGLAAVYGTATQHHGCINVYSEPGTGTVFKLYLPTYTAGISTATTDDSVIRGTGGILLVDDETLVRCSGQNLLEDLGYTVYTAENGEQALEVYGKQRDNIALVILDMVMPKMGGKETLIQLTASNPDVKVLISSGFHQEGTIKELQQCGAQGFIQKPYKKVELCKAVAMVIGNNNHTCSEQAG